MNRVQDYMENNTEKVLINKGLFCSLVASMLAVAVGQDANPDEVKELFDQCMAEQSEETREKIRDIILDLVHNAKRYAEEENE